VSKFVAKSQHLTGTPPVAYSLEHPVQTTGFRNLELRVSLLPQTAVCCRLFSADLRIDFAIKHLHHPSPRALPTSSSSCAALRSSSMRTDRRCSWESCCYPWGV